MYRLIDERARAFAFRKARTGHAAAIPMNLAPPAWAVSGPAGPIPRAPAIRKTPAPDYSWSSRLGPLASDIWS